MPEPTSTTTLPLTPGTYKVDPNHSGVYFKVRHIGLTNVHGRFDRFDASLVVGDTLDATRIEATIDLSSVDTNNADRDTHLLSTDFFHADQHPSMTFASTAIRRVSDDDYELDGELTLNGVTQPVTLEVEFTGAEVFPGDGKLHAGFSATADVNRDDFGVDFNMPMGVDKFALGKKIKVEIEIQFLAPEA